jgi:hypothetical protein
MAGRTRARELVGAVPAAVAALWCKGWGGRRPGGRSACLPPFAAAWVRGPLPGAPASAVTLPPRADLTPTPPCAILYERAHFVMETMALYRLYTSSSQKQGSAGTSSAPPCARSATLGPPALLLAFPRTMRALSHSPQPPLTARRAVPLHTLLSTAVPVLVPCSSPVPRAGFRPASPTVAPQSHHAANLLLYQAEQVTTSSPPVGRTSVRPLTLLSSPCSTAIHAPPAHCPRIAPLQRGLCTFVALLLRFACPRHYHALASKSVPRRCAGAACLQCDGLLMELWGGLKSALRFA